jgi:hypothetical protein
VLGLQFLCDLRSRFHRVHPLVEKNYCDFPVRHRLGPGKADQQRDREVARAINDHSVDVKVGRIIIDDQNPLTFGVVHSFPRLVVFAGAHVQDAERQS